MVEGVAGNRKEPKLTVFSARVEHHMLQNLLSHDNIEIRYGTAPVSISIDEPLPHNSQHYPVRVSLVKVKPEHDGMSCDPDLNV